MSGPIQRRRFLLTIGSSLVAGSAGCLSNENGESEHNGSSNHSHGNKSQSHDKGHSKHGSGNSSTHAHDQKQELGNPQSEAIVEMATNDGYHYLPHVVHIEAGGTVTWKVKSGSHNTTAYHPDTHGDQQRLPDGAEPWASDLLSEKGDTFKRKFETEGVYDYVCTPHEQKGMVGSIIVGWPDPNAQPGLQSPSDTRPDAAVDQLKRFNKQVRKVLENGTDSSQGNHNESSHGSQNESSHGDHSH